MTNYENYDLTYVTIDSLSEGVGSSQIVPLIKRLNDTGLKIRLISFEKANPNYKLIDYFRESQVDWQFLPFGPGGVIGGVDRLNKLRRAIPKTNLIHARSDIPAVSSIASNQAPVLWDVRSLWADQKIMKLDSFKNRGLYNIYKSFENISAYKSLGMSTLTNAIVPLLEQRHGRLPSLRIVVPTSVDLQHFVLQTKLPTEVKVLFSGTYSDYYDLELSAEFLRELSRKVEIRIDWARPIETVSTQLGVGEENVFPVTQGEMARIIPFYSFGMSVCKLDAGPSLAAAMPTKIAEFLACGRPIVVNKGLGDLDELVKEFDAGVILDGTRSNLVTSSSNLLRLLRDPLTPSRCRALAEKHFNLENGVEKYLKLYSQILTTKS